MEEDRLSSLPEDVKNKIFSLLPSIKDVVRTGSLSKSLLRTWRSFEVTDFQFWLIAPEAVVRETMRTGFWKGECESFIRFVNDALMRSSRDPMPRFNLSITAETIPHIERWLGKALDNHVEDLSLEINRYEYMPRILPEWIPQIQAQRLPYPIPRRVLRAGFIKSLTLGGNVLVDAQINPVSLPSLRSLSLVSCHIKNRMFRRLLRACPLLEELTVKSCHLLCAIEILNLNHLKSVTVAGRFSRLDFFNIKAPALESLCLSCLINTPLFPKLVVHESPNLRSLECKGEYVTDVSQFLSKFPLLESLKLTGRVFSKKIWILNPFLKNIVIGDCGDMVDIRIETPELSSFRYTGQCNIFKMALPSLRTTNPPFNCAVGFSFVFFVALNASWFEELQKVSPGWSSTFGCLESTVHLYEFGKGFTDEVYMGMPLLVVPEKSDRTPALSLPGVQHLKLQFEASESCYPDILDGLFSNCRPTTIFLSGTYLFRKFVCEALANREGYPNRCSSEAESWKHELKDVKIKSIRGRCGPLDWGSLTSLLPTLTTGDEICLGLQWRG